MTLGDSRGNLSSGGVQAGGEDDLWPLLQQLAEDCLTEIDAARLESLLAGSAALRFIYLQFIHLHGSLQWDNVADLRALPRNEADGPRDASASQPGGEPRQSRSQSRAADQAKTARGTTISPIDRRKSLWHPRPVSLLAAAGTLLAALGILALIRLPHYRGGSPSDASDNRPAPGIAAIVAQADCVWASHSKHDVGDELPAGQMLSLQRGTISLRLKNGVRLVCEGPVHLSLLDAMRVDLRLGRLTARVPQRAVGFAVHTPTLKVVDLGTEFGVEVDERGLSEVHVFSGAASVTALTGAAAALDASEEPAEAGNSRPEGGGDRAEQSRRLAAGEAARVTADQKLEAIDIAADRFAYADRLDPAGENAAREYAALIEQAKPVLYLSMDRLAGNRLLDSMPGEHHGIHYAGTWQRKFIARGKVGSALQLHGPQSGDYAMVPNYPASQTGELSVVAWVYAEERVHWGSIAKNWAEVEPGQFHFGLHNLTGDLDVHVTQANGETVNVREGERSPLPVRRWQHVAFTADGKTLRLYRNGVEVGSAPCAPVVAQTDITVLGIGVKPYGNDDESVAVRAGFWHGMIDELAVFDRALPVEVIQKLAGIGNGE